MNWNDLKVFLAIAEAKTLAGAARTLQQNHSTIFRRLNQLEESLSVRLFERLNTGYLLTPAGERMLELALEAEHAMHEIERDVAARDLLPRGTVRLTTAPNLARTLVPQAIYQLRRDFPDIVVEVATADTDYDLNRREADIALRATTNPPAHLVGRKLLDLQWWICASNGKKHLPQVEADLNHFPLIGADPLLSRLTAFQWLDAKHGDAIVARSNDLSAMAAMANAGIGLALLPSDQKEKGLRRLFSVDGLNSELWLLTHPDLRKVTKISVVWDALRAAVMRQIA